jgi:phenylalanyl-tRNA synthetase beta chain
MVLDRRLTPGEKLNKALNLSDKVIEIDLTPNRPDCACVLGIAREIAGLQKVALRYPEVRIRENGHDIRELTSVKIEAPELCPRYAARLVSGIKVAPSPFWLQDRLMSVGLRPINNIVDITNFVLMESGQPLHAFDFDRLAERRIVVRAAKAGEPFVSLDGKERSLLSETLMICDAEKPVAIGGVMGGLNSEIEEGTTRVLIESAYFNPISIRKTSKALGLNTEASYRFERGVDPAGTITALNRAALMMAEIAGGKIVTGLIDEHPRPVEIPQLRLSVQRTNRLLGTAFDADQIATLLKSIEFKVKNNSSETLEIRPPTFRVDIARPEDLMEEVARLWGYNQIPATFPAMPAEARPTLESLDVRNRIRGLMTGFGFSEAINYSFIASNSGDRLRLKPEDPRRNAVAILNPLSEEQAIMRTSLIPGLLETMQRNLSRQEKNLKLFEIGKVYLATAAEQLPEETEYLAGLWTGNRSEASWHSKETACDFYDLKGVVEGLLQGLAITGVDTRSLPKNACTYMRPGHSAEILVQRISLGRIGEIHPDVLSRFDLKQTAYLFELNVDALLALVPKTKQSKPIPKFPAVSRDITLIVDKKIASGNLLKFVDALEEELIENIHLFDIFDGKPIPAGMKSISFRITYRSSARTLEDDEVNRLHKNISARLLKEFDASLPT